MVLPIRIWTLALSATALGCCGMALLLVAAR
jgi:hypothetical protein